MLTCVLYIGAHLYSGCGRYYISACMVQHRSRRVAPSSVRRPAGGGGFSAEEGKMIPQLLDLLRSGALASLLSAASPVSTGATPQSQKSPKAPSEKPRQDVQRSQLAMVGIQSNLQKRWFPS